MYTAKEVRIMLPLGRRVIAISHILMDAWAAQVHAIVNIQ